MVVKRRPALPIASLRVELKNYAEASRFEQKLSNAVPRECLGNLHGVLWHRCADSGSYEAEPFVTLKKRIDARVPCDLKYLPEATLACAYSGDDDESAELAYASKRQHLKAQDSH